jgi:hypothetical protein
MVPQRIPQGRLCYGAVVLARSLVYQEQLRRAVSVYSSNLLVRRVWLVVDYREGVAQRMLIFKPFQATK